jgi:hypothetical protein
MFHETRQLSITESERLNASVDSLEKTLHGKLNWKAISLLSFATILFAIHIYYYEDSNWSLPSKFLVCVCPIAIWIIVENKYKGRKKENKILDHLKRIRDSGLITVLPVNTNRIIEFQEKEDEGTLFLIEINKNERIYLDDEQWLISPTKFPCDKFDIYLDKDFAYTMGRKIYCTGKKIESLKVPGTIKWKYFEDGFPEDLSKEPKTFDEILSEIKTIELQNLI